MKKFLSTEALIAAAFGVTVAGGFALMPKVFAPGADAQPIAIRPPAGAPMSFADLIEQVEPAVVSVEVVVEQKVPSMQNLEDLFEPFRIPRQFDRNPEGGEKEDQEEEPETREGRSLGSGFFISSDGYIVTNNHVVEGATKIQVTLKDKRELDAELVGADKATDIAVLKVKQPGPYQYVKFGNSHQMRKGDWVVALGNPFGLGGTATAGILSADGRELGGENPYTDYLQTDASINRGNSGGPTFDLYGNVVGVNTAIFSPTGGSVGIGFAIPAELASEVSTAIVKNGKVSRGWLGVTIQDFTKESAELRGLDATLEGAAISDVTPGSPAEKAGLRRNDIILAVNGQRVEDSTSTTRLVAKLIANTSNSFDIIRDGKRQTVTVLVGERPVDPYARPEPVKAATTSSNTNGTELAGFGAKVKPLDADTRTRLDLRPSDAGLVITEVTKKGLIESAGLEKDMVILDVNARAVGTVEAFQAAIAEAKAAGRDKVLLSVRIAQRTVFVPLELSGKTK